ncbi:hypothetical protein DSECCO2_560350 [anaerobic digester metagenome]
MHCFADRHENDSEIFQFVLHGCLYGYTVENRINSHSGQSHLFFERNAQFIECVNQFRIDFVHTFLFGLFGSSIITNVLKIDGRYIQVSPVGHYHFLPFAKSIQPKFKHEFRLVFFLRNHPDNIFIQPFGNGIHLNTGLKAVFVFTSGYFIQRVLAFIFFHKRFFILLVHN